MSGEKFGCLWRNGIEMSRPIRHRRRMLRSSPRRHVFWRRIRILLQDRIDRAHGRIRWTAPDAAGWQRDDDGLRLEIAGRIFRIETEPCSRASEWHHREPPLMSRKMAAKA